MSFKRKPTEALGADVKRPKANSSITAFFGAPKSSPSSSKSFASGTGSFGKPFDKEAWVATLNDEQKGLLKLEINTLHESWLAQLKDELVTKEFLDLKRFLKREVESGKKVFPESKDVYSWSRFTPLDTVKVVILGQDPYHNVNQAHGLCFSVQAPTPAPASLVNIYKALAIDYPDFKPPPNRAGLLTPWAEQGVLMLNAVLTVQAHNANSHQKKGWERFTQRAIDAVVDTVGKKRGVVFLAWGGYAQKRVAGIRGKSLILKSVHPSPLGAYSGVGFFNNGHFKKANEFLRQNWGPESEINWQLAGGPPTTLAAAKKATSKTAVVKAIAEEGKEDESEATVIDKGTFEKTTTVIVTEDVKEG